MKITLLSKITFVTFAVIITLGITACSDNKPRFTIEGQISGADSTMLYLSKRMLSTTTVVDSVKLDKDGTFAFKELAPETPNFYLLSLNGMGINLAVDSIETIVVNAAATTFATEYRVEGSEASVQLKEVVLAQYKLNGEINNLKQQLGKKQITGEEFTASVTELLQEYKDLAMKVILSDKTGLSGYFAVFQKIEDHLIFDPSNKSDLRAYQAVATRWEKIESERAKHITEFTLTALSKLRQAQKNESTLSELLANSSETNTSDFYNLELPDIKSKNVNLSSLRGKVVILDFTTYLAKFSPTHNAELNKLHEKYKSAGLEIYQVTFDPDIHAWQNAAVNLPWICVRDAKGADSNLFAKFNISDLPTTFVIDKQGNLVKRILPEDKIEREVQKII